MISRDTDILREYLAALDGSERGISPFARIAAIVKLARLRRELRGVQLETTDEDVARLRREVDDRLDRNVFRRLVSGPLGSRVALFLGMVIGQQLALLAVLFATVLFVKLVPPLRGWNPAYPNDQPVFLVVFVFVFLFAPPMLALAALFGGRYFRSWRVTLPATLLVIVICVVGTVMVFRRNSASPVRQHPSLTLFARDRELNSTSYREWTSMNWLMNDAKFQSDYEVYLRKGPGRWITSGLKDDAAWNDSLRSMNEYLDGGQDPSGFREWLTDYLTRNRIYSEDRVPQEVDILTGEANQRFLGVWQVEPFLKERDQRIYRAYLGSINSSMKRWALVTLGVFAVLLLGFYLIGPALSVLESAVGRARRRSSRNSDSPYAESGERYVRGPTKVAKLREGYYSFPERSQITSPPFFDAPFKLLSRVHRSFVSIAVSTILLVFVFWAAIYGLDLAAGRENASSFIDYMRSQLLFAGSPSSGEYDNQAQVIGAGGPSSFSYGSRPVAAGFTIESPLGTAYVKPGSDSTEAILASRVVELEGQVEDGEYESSKKFKEQSRLIASQRNEIDLLRSVTDQFQQTTMDLPSQVAELTTRATAAESRASEVMGEAGSAKQKAEAVEKTLTTRIGEVENRAKSVGDQVGRVEDRTSVLQTRTEAMEREFDRRTKQVEARTEELGERTAGIKEREDRADQLSRIALKAIFTSITSDVDALDRRIESAFYRLFSKGEAQRDLDSLRGRIRELEAQLKEVGTDYANEMLKQLEPLSQRLDQIATRIK
ncbi:MAG TPA: hypothetical protein VG778_01790 [Blastocatellia bacterium]|nr:hypothetical protein [Blastocatellia bacterium]